MLRWIRLERRPEAPLYRQIADQIRRAVLAGRIRAGEVLPASRALAAELGVSRITTLQAYEQLTAEGLLESRRGSGTRVAGTTQGLRLRPRAAAPFQGRHLNTLFDEPPSLAFRPGIPAFDAFPALLWSRLLQRHGARLDRGVLDYAHVGGYGPLRQELAKYLLGSRSVDCRPEQVIVVSCARAAVWLASRVLWRPGETVAVEDPGYGVVRRVIAAAGHPLRHVPVDADGIRAEDLWTGPGSCAGVYVTPAHHWPTGRTMSAGRRMALLDWAARSGGWIIEDDYDSEFHFDSPPVAPLHAFGGRVIYVGTFSKTLAPSIRAAYLVVPRSLVKRFEREAFQQGCEPPLHVQAALADLLAGGHFVRHVGRMRKLYARRRDLLVHALRESFGDRLEVERPPGGLQLVATLPSGVPTAEASRKAAEAGVIAWCISNWHVLQPAPNALQLGFAAVPEREIAPGVARLHAAIAPLF